ncbi:hypothetical protein B0T18DRAFT_56768 [Schizothecium vesticola]|uniref:Ricin B lectin domain-containing protein n=1 Tax=Schizothecium vesticola TaxID=314040 RepID=A0AA40F3X0_9PEZI|nr:hypothetical protein B0T18DRAFT_56768 [Schizothecium vesticola]
MPHAIPSHPPIIPLNLSTWYRLQPAALPDLSLDVINDGTQLTVGNLQLASTGDFSGQHWRLVPSATHPGYFRLVTMWLGPARALDVYGVETTEPRLAETGDEVAGQQWQLIGQGGDVWRLTNMESGPDSMFLDIQGDQSGVVMTEGRRETQRWRLVRIREMRTGEGEEGTE